MRATMESSDANKLHYQRANFSTRLPEDRLYSPSHFWLLERQGTWRIGFTKFATRLLGQVVDYGFEVQPMAALRVGQVLGWVEGFKSVSELCCVIDGRFVLGNPLLAKDPEAIDHDCYGQGWLYEATGQPQSTCTLAQGYKAILDDTIDELLRSQKSPG